MGASPRTGPKSAYAYGRDPEKGLSLSPASPTRMAKRLFPTKKTKWIFIFAIGVTTIFYLSSTSDSELHRPYGEARPPPDGGYRGGQGDSEDIWDDTPVEEPQGWGWGIKLPFGKSGTTDGKGKGSEIVPDDGQQLGSGGVPHSQQQQPPQVAQKPLDAKGLATWVEPMHPDLSVLLSPAELFPEVKLPDFLEPPEYNPFPDTQLREIISDEVPEEQERNVFHMPEDAFSKQWIGPHKWNDPQPLRRVQWEGFAGGRDQWETDDEKKVRGERREAVRRGFAHAWQAYKRHAWGHDEVKPVSQQPSNPFNNWGATIVDTLDTLLVMGFSDEYNLCRPHVNQLNFHWHGGRDWSRGYISEPPPTDDEETPAETWQVSRDRFVALPVFETSIRYIGGLLGAYDLSGDSLLLERAVDLATVLSKAFNTESGLPMGRMDPGNIGDFKAGSISIAEAGSMSLEFIRLAQITGDRKWFDLVQRAMDYLEIRVIPRSVQNPLIPHWFQPDAGLNAPLDGPFTWGGLTDSYYEYLIKTYKLLGASEAAAIWRRVYEKSVDKARDLLFHPITYIPDHDLLAIGKFERGRSTPEIEHLTSFAGGMLGMGARLLDRPKDFEDGEKFTATCYWVSASTITGLQPEGMEFFKPGEEVWENVEVSNAGDRHHPYVDPSSLEENGLDTKVMHRDRNGVLRWNGDEEPVLEKDGGTPEVVTTETVKKLKGKSPGIKRTSGRGINRPENIESVFYMYRLTGDRKWQEKGWKMFVSWMEAAKVPGGISSIDDVNKEGYKHGDNMESFTLAETFKYHFLLQADPEILSLDDYVLNTEAHPLIANPDIAPGHGRFWHPPPDPNANLGVRGQGTDAQKWTRRDVLYRARPIRPVSKTPRAGVGIPVKPGGNNYDGSQAGYGGGRGMGGGGGDPNYRPKPF